MIDFNDPTTWDQPLSDVDALNMGIFGLNTLAHPDASSESDLSSLDFFTEGAVEKLCELRDRLDGEPVKVHTAVITANGGEYHGTNVAFTEEQLIADIRENFDPEGEYDGPGEGDAFWDQFGSFFDFAIYTDGHELR